MVGKRRVIVGTTAVVVVAAAAVTGWFWLRPWAQANALGDHFRDISGVTTVDKPDSDHDYYRIQFAAGASFSQLSKGSRNIQRALDKHLVSGDRQSADVQAGSFVLAGVDRKSLPDGVLRAVVALNGVDGISGIDAEDYEIRVIVPKTSDLMTSAIRTLDTLAKEQTRPTVPLPLRFYADDGNTEIHADLFDPAGQRTILQRLDRLARKQGLALSATHHAGAIGFYVGPNEKLSCGVDFTLAHPENMRRVADAVAGGSRPCVTSLSTQVSEADTFTLNFDKADLDPGRAFELRDRLVKIGVDVDRINTGLKNARFSVKDGKTLEALRKFTLDRTVWTPAAKAKLDVTWAGTDWYALKDKTVAILEKYGSAMVRIRDHGFLISAASGDAAKNRFTVTDDVDGAPVLMTLEGREAMVKAIRGSGFPGTGQFTISNKDSDGALAFTATTTSTASDVQLPSGTDVSWADDFIGIWNASAR